MSDTELVETNSVVGGLVEKPSLDDLLPDRHPQQDLFLCDVSDAILKDIMPHMEHPFYSLSKKPEMHTRHYERKNDRGEVNSITIKPGGDGMATIYDKDILIFCISQMMAKLNRGEKMETRSVLMNARDFFMFSNRSTSGQQYKALVASIERLQGMQITTNFYTEGKQRTEVFGLIEKGAVEQSKTDGRMLTVELTLSDWVFNAIRAKQVLTLHRDYFRLRKPIERRIYELARKHVGKKSTWKISLENLLAKTGSHQELKRFRHNLKAISETDLEKDHFPDYSFEVVGDDVVFVNKGTMLPKEKLVFQGHMPQAGHDAARKAAPGYDVYALEHQWRVWVSNKSIIVKNPATNFEKFCKSYYKRHGPPD